MKTLLIILCFVIAAALAKPQPYDNSYDDKNHLEDSTKSPNPCSPDPCGTGAKCESEGQRAVCKCLDKHKVMKHILTTELMSKWLNYGDRGTPMFGANLGGHPW